MPPEIINQHDQGSHRGPVDPPEGINSSSLASANARDVKPQSGTGRRQADVKSAADPESIVITPPPFPGTGSEVGRGNADRVRDNGPAGFPAGTIERLDQRFSSLLTEREHVFKLGEGLKERDKLAKDLDMRRDMLAVNMDLAGLPDHLPDDKLLDAKYMTKLLSGHPRILAEYQNYAAARYMHDALDTRVTQELGLRRQGVAKIINEEAKSLFPDAAIPSFEVGRLDGDGRASARYRRASILLRDSDLIPKENAPRIARPAGAEGPSGTKDLTSSVVHEMRHGEQDGLLIRKYIDEVVPPNSANRVLTEEEVSRVAERFAKVGGAMPAEVIHSINEQRQGRRLSPSELERADGIEASKLERRQVAAAHEADHQREDAIKQKIHMLEVAPMLASSFLQYPETLNRLFDGKIPPAVADLVSRYGKGETLDQDHVKQVLVEAMRAELAQVSKINQGHYEQYRKWRHEEESHADHQDAEKKLGMPAEEKLLRSVLGLGKGEDTHSGPVYVAANKPFYDKMMELSKAPGNESLAMAYETIAEEIADEPDALTDPKARKAFVDRLASTFDSEFFDDEPELKAAFNKAYAHAADVIAGFDAETGQFSDKPAAAVPDPAGNSAADAGEAELRSLGLGSKDQSGIKAETAAAIQQRVDMRLEDLRSSGRLSEEAKDPDKLRRELGVSDQELERLSKAEKLHMAEVLKGKLLAYGIAADLVPNLVNSVLHLL